jgi:glutamate/tyrosine decarboxylase-like PLP-dependent enzyme
VGPNAGAASLAAVPDPFADHPEPELVDLRHEAVSRPALERLGTAIWDEALRYLYEDAMERPLRSMPYPEMRHAFFGPSGEPAPAPQTAAKAEEVLGEFRERVAPYVFNTQHPGSYSYFTPPPLAMSIAGEVLAQWVNQGVDVWVAGPVSALVEEEVTAWLRTLIGFGEGSWAVLTSGGVMANIMALTVARDIHLARLLGLDDPPRAGALEGARVYASDQAHFSISRALDVLGFPPETLRIVPSDDRFRLHAAPVADAVADDRVAGLTPCAIAAVAGSTNTGSVDLTGELADLAERERLWLHVDAAYGGGAAFSPRVGPRVPDLERADSVTIDPHKWFFQAYDIGALVVKRREELRQTFHRTPEYYRHPSPEDAPLNWFEYSIEGTRRFRALKLWLSWKHLGTSGFARLIEHNVDLAAYLVARCREAPDFEVVPDEPELSVVCFRHVPGGLEGEALDAYQDRLQLVLEASGEAWVSTTKIRGATYLRAGIVNYLSREADIDRMLEALRREAPRVRAGLRG